MMFSSLPDSKSVCHFDKPLDARLQSLKIKKKIILFNSEGSMMATEHNHAI